MVSGLLGPAYEYLASQFPEGAIPDDVSEGDLGVILLDAAEDYLASLGYKRTTWGHERSAAVPQASSNTERKDSQHD